jgi:hypothetical protein
VVMLPSSARLATTLLVVPKSTPISRVIRWFPPRRRGWVQREARAGCKSY